MASTPITSTPAGSASTDDVWIRREQRAGRITLNRPQALNALTWPMVKAIKAALLDWRDDPDVQCVILDGAGDRGLCAGGDVRWLYNIRSGGVVEANQFWHEEYSLNSLIAQYSKPFVALMDGIVMGGGIGLSAHARHRIVTERSQIAMPETTIGLVPDVGGTWLLSRAQGRLGVYLGLTGARMSGSDAIQVGFADTYLASGRLSELVNRLTTEVVESVDDIIEAMAEPVPVSGLTAKRDLIDQLFAGDTLAAVQANLLTTTDPLAAKARADLAARSPKALALTLEAIQRAKAYSRLEDALMVEFRLVTRLYEDGEFSEGVRALLIDKDKAPKWNPPAIEAVTSELITSYFAPLARDWPR